MAVPDLTKKLPTTISIGEKYGPAMTITDQAEADVYFELLVEHSMRGGKRSREEAEKIERMNLGYYAGYGFDREQVERLYRCAHPYFGAIAENGPPTAREAFLTGVDAAKSPEVFKSIEP